MNKEERHTPNYNSRRTFMQQMALCYMAAHLPLSFVGCADNDVSYIGSGKPPYKIWEEMLMALQTCPDYLEGRMKALVASKDPEAMFNFVRDEIYLMPTSNKAIGYSGSQFKWGIKGALRYGMATPREKAELLNQMLSHAGFASKVMFERTDIGLDEAMSYFFRPIERKYDLEVSKKQWKQWKKDLKVDADFKSEIPVFDPDLSKTNALAEQLWNFIPDKENLRTSAFDFRWDNYRTPTVQFEKDGEIFYAHLFDPNIPFGKLKNDGRLNAAEPISLNDDTVEIKLTYREAIHPDQELDLISGSWNARDLIGSQVHFANLSGLDLEQSAYTPVGSLRIFTPTLAFQDFDATLEVMEERSFIADPLTLEGKKIQLPDAQENANAPIVFKATSPELLKSINEVSVKAIPVNKYLIKLEVTPIDAEGKFVEGLQARDFTFADNEQPTQVLMESNRQAPSVLILYDGSLSMPLDYSGENMDRFVKNLEESILLNFPAANIQKWVTSSNLFTWLLKASKTSYDLIVFATDGDNDDAYNEKDFESYTNGSPAIILNVNNIEAIYVKESFGKMAEVTNGLVLDAKDQAATMEKIVDYVNGLEIPPYTFSFYAIPVEKHKVLLQIDQKRLTASAEFSLQIDRDPLDVNQGIIGIYLDMMVGRTQVKRVLAGWDPITQRYQKPTNAHFQDVKSLMLGGTTFYFEGEGPTVATLIVDLLKYKLSTRGWGEALLENDLETAKTEFEKGVYQYHPKAMSLLAPLDNHVTKNSFTFSSGMRVGIYKQQLHIEGKKATESFDFLPTSNYESFTKDNADAFKINLQKTAQLAIREASVFRNSTYASLSKIPLMERTDAINKDWFKDLDTKDLDYYYWYERLYRGNTNFKVFDPSKVNTAFWEISAQGELYGILRDGTGGGSDEEILQELSEIMMVMRIYIAVLQKMRAVNSIGGTSLAIVAVYGVTLVRLYAIVCETIVLMDARGMNAKIAEALKEFAHNVANIIFYSFGGSAFGKMPGLDHLIESIEATTNPYN